MNSSPEQAYGSLFDDAGVAHSGLLVAVDDFRRNVLNPRLLTMSEDFAPDFIRANIRHVLAGRFGVSPGGQDAFLQAFDPTWLGPAERKIGLGRLLGLLMFCGAEGLDAQVHRIVEELA
jgi:hypothetical protein